MCTKQLSWLMLLALALAGTLLVTSPRVDAQDPTFELGLNTVPVYLGPDVVISGFASHQDGLPEVNVVIEDITDGGGGGVDAIVFEGPAAMALRPPLGIPAGSWRVPLNLPDGSYLLDVTLSFQGEILGNDGGFFDVVSETTPDLEIFGIGALWSYYDEGDEPAASVDVPPVPWYGVGYDVTLWDTGPGELGYGDGDEATVTDELGIFGQKIVAQYFRHEFEAPDLSQFDRLVLSVLRDDGAIVYLNGVELGRTNMPEGPVNYLTDALTVSEQIIEIALTPADLVAGTNLLAVEVHQASAASTDLSFSASLVATKLDAPKVSNNTPGTLVLAAGDMARCNFDGDEAVAAQMAELFDTDAGIFVGLGDLVYNSGTIDEFTNCYDPTLGQFRSVTWPAPGNHEHYTFPNAAGYREYFGPAAGPTAGPAGGLWYSFDVDEYWHIIALDSDCRGREVLPGALGTDGCAVGSEQELWLRADLEANQDKNILAFFHHPPYTNNQYTDHEYTWPLWRALAEYGAEITLHGHEHHYERYKPLDYWGVPVQGEGLREFIIGSGGTFPRYDIRPQKPESEYKGVFPQGTNDFGVMQLWLQPDGYEWKWESIYGLAASDAGVGGLVAPMERASFTGVVVEEISGDVLADIEVCAIAARTDLRTCTRTGAAGAYEIGPLVSDTYTLNATDDDFSNGAHDGLAAQGVELVAPADTMLELPLTPLSSISGSTEAIFSGDPVAFATVCATPIDGFRNGCANTDATGSYEIVDLPPQGYEVTFEATGWISQCYDDTDVPCDSLTRTAVEILADDVSGIDAVLRPGPGAISGTVVSEDGSALPGIEACVDSFRLPEPLCMLTDSAGFFEVGELLSGNYIVSYNDPASIYLGECYRDRPCDQPLLVGVIQPGVRTGIDADLAVAPFDPDPGDVNCSRGLNIADALVIAQYTVGNRDAVSTCPLTDPVTQINVGAADTSGDTLVNVVDALLIAQCTVDIPNALCP